MINRKFINFKTYSGFLAKKNDIPEDSIVFIQDKHCIWARGKEYICDGPYTSSVENGLLTFKNGDNSIIFTISQLNGTIEFVDQNGVETRATYVLNKDFQDAIEDVLSRIPTVDSQLDPDSKNPVLNKAIYNKLLSKADEESLSSYVLTNTYEDDKRNILQEKLYEDYGIDIYREPRTNKLKIKSTLDTNVYLIVDSIESVTEPNPNKIYLVEAMNQDGTYRYIQYRYRNGQWVSFDAIMPTIDLSGFETAEDASSEHEAIWNAINAIDLTPYAKIINHINPIYETLNNYALTDWVLANFAPFGDYATKKYVDDNFVKKEYVYHPKQGDWGTDDSSGSGGGVISPVIQLITIDLELKPASSNPVANWALYVEFLKKANASDLNQFATIEQLNSKANSSELSNYVRNGQLQSELDLKQNRLTAGSGISIINDVISCDLDTEPFVIVSELPVTDISNNKIYIVETIGDNDQRSYESWKHTDDPIRPWRSLGTIDLGINLSDYYRNEDADALELRIAGTYLTQDSAISLYQPKRDDYALQDWVHDNYQEKGDYVELDTVTQIIQDILEIRDTYVRKRDVYEPENGGSSTPDITPTNPDSPGGDNNDDPGNGNDPGGGNSGDEGNHDNEGNGNSCNCDHNIPKLITLTVSQYEQLIEEGTTVVEGNTIQFSADTYYFTYEWEEDDALWHFGDHFPVILTGEWAFGLTFPVILN